MKIKIIKGICFVITVITALFIIGALGYGCYIGNEAVIGFVFIIALAIVLVAIFIGAMDFIVADLPEVIDSIKWYLREIRRRIWKQKSEK